MKRYCEKCKKETEWKEGFAQQLEMKIFREVEK